MPYTGVCSLIELPPYGDCMTFRIKIALIYCSYSHFGGECVIEILGDVDLYLIAFYSAEYPNRKYRPA